MIEKIWTRIKIFEGEKFYQKRGAEFTYEIIGNKLKLSRTNRDLPKSEIEKAVNLMPVKNTVPFQNLQAPSYLYAILADKRIREDSW